MADDYMTTMAMAVVTLNNKTWVLEEEDVTTDTSDSAACLMFTCGSTYLAYICMHIIDINRINSI